MRWALKRVCRGSEGGVVWGPGRVVRAGGFGRRQRTGCDGMSRVGAYGAEIHIGEPIQYESERSTLKEIERLLVADKRRAVVFANFTVDSRQIDLVIVLESLVPVIEAKGRTRPVRGRANGPWQVSWHRESGKTFRILMCRHAIRRSRSRMQWKHSANAVFHTCRQRLCSHPESRGARVHFRGTARYR